MSRLTRRWSYTRAEKNVGSSSTECYIKAWIKNKNPHNRNSFRCISNSKYVPLRVIMVFNAFIDGNVMWLCMACCFGGYSKRCSFAVFNIIITLSVCWAFRIYAKDLITWTVCWRIQYYPTTPLQSFMTFLSHHALIWNNYLV